MKYLIVLLTSTLSTAKVTFQSLVAKKERCNAADSLFINMLMFFAASLLFCPYLFSISAATWPFAIAYAISNVVFQMVYTCALSRGNVSVAVMFANFGMLVPIALSGILYDEIPSVTRLIGIILTLIAFVFTWKQGADQKRGYRLLVILAMLANGCSLSIQKLFAASGTEGSIFSFVSASYMLSALLCAVLYCAMRTTGRKRNFAAGPRVLLASSGAGISLALFLALNTYAAKVVDGSFLYPAHSGCTILLATLSGIVIFRDKLSKRQAVACALGGISIVLMNF